MKSLLDGWRTLLILGRVSNLPTVWSNLVAGSILAGAMAPETIADLLLGGSFLYIGGMYLNDFCDAAFDAQYCPQRPIPAGKIARRTVGLLALIWFVLGLVCLLPCGFFTPGVALALICTIVLYDYNHKNVAWAPIVMGACRFQLYLLPASALVETIPGSIFLWGAILGLYVAGITYLARGESRPEKPARWALVLLLLPVAASGVAYVLKQTNPVSAPRPLFGAVLLIWMAWLILPFWRKTHPSLGRVVSGLLAGIVFVDAIAVTPLLGLYAAWFALFFALALVLQRVIPAT